MHRNTQKYACGCGNSFSTSSKRKYAAMLADACTSDCIYIYRFYVNTNTAAAEDTQTHTHTRANKRNFFAQSESRAFAQTHETHTKCDQIVRKAFAISVYSDDFTRITHPNRVRRPSRQRERHA